jgi:hypothetical protein
MLHVLECSPPVATCVMTTLSHPVTYTASTSYMLPRINRSPQQLKLRVGPGHVRSSKASLSHHSPRGSLNTTQNSVLTASNARKGLDIAKSTESSTVHTFYLFTLSVNCEPSCHVLPYETRLVAHCTTLSHWRFLFESGTIPISGCKGRCI